MNYFRNILGSVLLFQSASVFAMADSKEALNAAFLKENVAYEKYLAAIEEFGPVQPFVGLSLQASINLGMLKLIYMDLGFERPEVPDTEVSEFGTKKAACKSVLADKTADVSFYTESARDVQSNQVRRSLRLLRTMTNYRDIPALKRCAGVPMAD